MSYKFCKLVLRVGGVGHFRATLAPPHLTHTRGMPLVAAHEFVGNSSECLSVGRHISCTLLWLRWRACHREHRCPSVCHLLSDRLRHFVLSASRYKRRTSEGAARMRTVRGGCCRCVTALQRQRRRRPCGRYCEESPCESERASERAERGRQAGRQAGRQTDRQTDRHAGRQADRHTDRHTDRYRHAGRHTGKQAGKQAGRLRARETFATVVDRV